MTAMMITLQKDRIQALAIGLVISTTILLSAIFNPLYGQTKIGVRGGLNISEPGLNTGIGNTSNLTKSFTGIDLALISEFSLGEKLSAQAELGYTERGIRLGAETNINVLGTAIPVGVTTTTKVRQLELPILAKYQISQGMVRTYASAGPTIGYAINGNFKTKGTLISDIDLANQNINLGNQNRWSVGVTGGLGLELDRGLGTLFVEARYQYQALKVSGLPLDDVRFNNNGVGFNIGFKIAI